MEQQKQQALEQILAGAVAAVGYELLGFEYKPQGRYSLLRIYIDSEAGINIDDCEKASRQISAVLEVEDPISHAYTLEVSSPGLERPLFNLAHYQRFIGHPIKMHLLIARDGQRNFKGKLISATEAGIDVEIKGEIERFHLDEIEKANLQVDI